MEDDKHPSNDRKSPVLHEQLYEEVWAEPMIKVALKYNVSSSFMARVCTWLNVPRPGVGYWAKLAVGKSTKRPSLPEAGPGDLLEWNRYGQAQRARISTSKPFVRTKPRYRDRSDLPKRHPILQGAEEYFDEARETDNGFLKPSKRLMVDVIASKPTCRRALDVSNELFLIFEEHGYSVSFWRNGLPLQRNDVNEREEGGSGRNYPYLWTPARGTVVTIGSVMIGLTIYEMTENVEMTYHDGKYIRTSELPVRKRRVFDSHSWTSKRDIPSGRLCVQAYSPYQRTDWKRQWREVKTGDFPGKLSTIVKELEQEAATIADLAAEAERKAEIERQEWEAQRIKWHREEEERQKAEAHKKSSEELSGIIKAWVTAKGIEEFFADVERRVVNMDEEKKKAVLERLAKARTMIENTDALQKLLVWKTPNERIAIKRND